LYKTNLFHPVKLGLQNIDAMHERVGRPMDSDDVVVVHVAGTNGKGSVCYKIATALARQNDLNDISNGKEKKKKNLAVGLFCSPHVSSFRERMQVNGELITEREVAELLPRIYELCREHDIPATFFEITTLLAFLFFERRGADVVVLETGLGGRLDATNVVRNPALTVITSIGLEHTRILGDTVEAIAEEKAGILKPDCPILVGPHVPHDVIRRCAQEKKAGPYYTSDEVLLRLRGESDADEIAIDDKDDYDVENTRIAVAALRLLRESHPDVFGGVGERAILDGTAGRPSCRFEQVELRDDDDDDDESDGRGSTISVVLDVAHNPPAMDYLVKKLKSSYPTGTKFRVVVGMSSDKDLTLCGKSILHAVDGDVSRIHLVEASHPRAAKLESILEKTGFGRGGEGGTTAHFDLEDRSITKQIRLATDLIKKSRSITGSGDGRENEQEEVLVVCGSVFLMAEAREALGFDEPRDSPYIAEVAGAGVRHSQENFGNTPSSPSPSPPPAN